MGSYWDTEGHRLRPLFDEPVLIIQQTSTVRTANFDILDGSGETPAGQVRTVDGGWSRLLMGPRKFEIRDDDDEVVLFLDDTVNLGRDTFVIRDRHRQPVAEVKKTSLFRARRLQLHLADGTEVDLRGDVWAWNFAFHLGDAGPARVRRERAGLGRAVAGHRRFVLEMTQQVPENVRLALL